VEFDACGESQRIQNGKRDVTAPVPVAVKWAGDTPVIMLTDHGGEVWGRVEKPAPAK